MIIMSQDRKRLIDCAVVEVSRNLGGGKDAKYVITANSIGFGGFIVGSYPEEKNAMDELEKIYAALASGAKTYDIK